MRMMIIKTSGTYVNAMLDVAHDPSTTKHISKSTCIYTMFDDHISEPPDHPHPTPRLAVGNAGHALPPGISRRDAMQKVGPRGT